MVGEIFGLTPTIPVPNPRGQTTFSPYLSIQTPKAPKTVL
jgi:hypothetical protein